MSMPIDRAVDELKEIKEFLEHQVAGTKPVRKVMVTMAGGEGIIHRAATRWQWDRPTLAVFKDDELVGEYNSSFVASVAYVTDG